MEKQTELNQAAEASQSRSSNLLGDNGHYRIVSRKWSAKGDMLVFWRPGGNGYTKNINEAGIFSPEEIKYLPIIEKVEDWYKLKSDETVDDIAVRVFDIALIGKAVTAIQF